MNEYRHMDNGKGTSCCNIPGKTVHGKEEVTCPACKLVGSALTVIVELRQQMKGRAPIQIWPATEAPEDILQDADGQPQIVLLHDGTCRWLLQELHRTLSLSFSTSEVSQGSDTIFYSGRRACDRCGEPVFGSVAGTPGVVSLAGSFCSVQCADEGPWQCRRCSHVNRFQCVHRDQHGWCFCACHVTMWQMDLGRLLLLTAGIQVNAVAFDLTGHVLRDLHVLPLRVYFLAEEWQGVRDMMERLWPGHDLVHGNRRGRLVEGVVR